MGSATVLINERTTGTINANLRRSFESMCDADLIAACQSGDHMAFDVLVRRYRRTVIGLLYQLAPDWTDIADLTQEVFIRVWRSINNLRCPFAFRSWLTHVTTNLFYDELRKRPVASTISMDECLRDTEDENTTRDLPDLAHMPDDIFERHELSKAIQEAISKLPRPFRTALFLREFDGLSYEEIAQITHAEIGTVKSRISRARIRVQNLLSPFIDAA
ncbi:MAG TPA: sigma-70 family RNA polymerase sigma factor [Chroococcales cyanobacterium]